jgi:hypothetical protein
MSTITLTAQQKLSPVGSIGASNLKDHKSTNYELKNQFPFMWFIDLKYEFRNQIILVLNTHFAAPCILPPGEGHTTRPPPKYSYKF